VLKNTSCERFFHVEYRRKTIRAFTKHKLSFTLRLSYLYAETLLKSRRKRVK